MSLFFLCEVGVVLYLLGTVPRGVGDQKCAAANILPHALSLA